MKLSSNSLKTFISTKLSKEQFTRVIQQPAGAEDLRLFIRDGRVARIISDDANIEAKCKDGPYNLVILIDNGENGDFIEWYNTENVNKDEDGTFLLGSDSSLDVVDAVLAL